MAPVVWLIGIPWSEAREAGALMGVKTVLNELLAYLELVSLPEASLSERSRLIMTYALCGFANFGSIAITLGGIGGIAPSRRKDLARFGLLAMVGGALASFTTAALAGILY